MPITAATVEANGWVLRVTVSGSAGSFASYTLDPDGNPRVLLATSHAGFVKSAGTAIAGSIARSLVGTKPVRRPVSWTGTTKDPAVIDEIDNGNGTVTARIALSEHVYATDTGLVLAVQAGWRTGEPAGTGIAVTNGSTAAAPVPIFRWALAPYDVTQGVFRLSLFVVSHHPVGFEPVAGVRFTVTDGTRTRTVWATELSTDNSHGDNLRCYSVLVDPGTATALTAGLLRCDAEVYPWLGAMRSTDAAGTRVMTGLGTAGFGVSAQSPFVIGYDPAGTRYLGQFLFVDPAGTATASAAMVQTSHAAAKAIAVASRPRDYTTALQALYLAARTLPAANGLAAQTRAADGARIRFIAGVHAGVGATAVTSGLTSAEIPVVLEGDPDDADPRANCILQTGTPQSGRVTRTRLRNIRIEAGGTALMSSTSIYWFLDNVELRGKAGSELSTVQPLSSAAVPSDQWNVCITRSKWHRIGFRIGAVSNRAGLLRASEHSRRADALTILRNRFVPATEDTTVTGNESGIGQWSGTAFALGAFEDVIAAFNDLRACRNRVWVVNPATAAAAATPNPSYRRLAFINNVCERVGSSAEPFWSMGETESATISYNIIEGNSFAGERVNAFYSDPLPVTVADTNTQLNQAFCNRMANNAFDRNASKVDEFLDPNTLNIRTAGGVINPTGYRPQMVETWSGHYGAGHEGNYDGGRATGSIDSNRREYSGLRSEQTAVAVYPGWTTDRSVLGTGTGLGDYRPAAGSPLLGRLRRGSSDRDFADRPRLALGAAGALEGTGIAVALVPEAARHGHRAAASLLAWSGSLLPARAVMASRAGVSGVAWQGAVAPARAVMASRAAPASVAVAVSIGPAPARLPMASLAAVVTVRSGGLDPAPAVHGLSDFSVTLLPGRRGGVAGQVPVGADVRVLLIPHN